MYHDRLKKSEWEVRPVSIDVAREIIEKYHYAHGAANTATVLHGLFKRDEWFAAPCYGVVWWMPPTRDAAAAWWPEPDHVLVLSRLVIVLGVPKNAATFLLMRSVKMLPDRWKCLLTYADTWQGHTGHIYRAAGWEYLGMTEAKPIFLVNGRMRATKAGPRTRTYEEMQTELGAEKVGTFSKHRFRYIRPQLKKTDKCVIRDGEK
jgi:hypothetical protein